jgi:hypothetical protein
MMTDQHRRMAARVANDQVARFAAAAAGVVVGCIATYLVIGEPRPTPVQPVVDEPEHATVATQCPPVHECPPPGALTEKCEPTILTVRAVTSVDPRFEAVSPTAVTEALQAATQAAGVHGMFAVDCSAYPCLAVFDGGEVPSMETRADFRNSFMAALPEGARVTDHTQIAQGGRVTWALFVAEDELTEADKTAIESRLGEFAGSD